VTRRGYCVHFATSFIVLARLNDIPSRYATGFMALRRQGGEGTVVTGNNAHAWPEVWLDDVGWVTVEPTPALNPGNVGLPDYYRLFNGQADDLTARQLEAITGNQFNKASPQGLDAGALLSFLLGYLPWMGAAAAAVLAVLLGLRVRRRRRGMMITYRGNLRRMNKVLLRLVACLERHAVPGPEHAGWTAWGAAVTTVFPGEKKHVAALVRTVNGVFFAGRPVASRHIAFMKSVGKRLRDAPHPKTGVTVT
jgi:hypothetical protein